MAGLVNGASILTLPVAVRYQGPRTWRRNLYHRQHTQS
jgi:hypothetical protein